MAPYVAHVHGTNTVNNDGQQMDRYTTPDSIGLPQIQYLNNDLEFGDRGNDELNQTMRSEVSTNFAGERLQ